MGLLARLRAWTRNRARRESEEQAEKGDSPYWGATFGGGMAADSDFEADSEDPNDPDS